MGDSGITCLECGAPFGHSRKCSKGQKQERSATINIEEEYFDELYHAVKSLLHPNRDDLDNDCAQYLLNEIDGRRSLEDKD